MSNPSADQDPFADIRPYNDSEVRSVIDRLLGHPQLLSMLARLRAPRLARLFGRALHPIVRSALRRQLGSVETVRDFQSRIETYVRRMVERSTDGFKVSGLERLEEGVAYLYISNHRDITLDPALVNYALYRQGRDTVRIAIGDNLLQRDYAADLMRLNKSFIVNRSVKAPRKLLAVLRHLSSYILHSICEDNVPVWIAQRDGRAKDGWDRTEPAIIKMLTMSMPKGHDLSEHIKRLRIVPVSISYELDPCDLAKARELSDKQRFGRYEKGEDEDLRSIGLGISGDKGVISIVFGQMLTGQYDSVNSVATAVDLQVVGNYPIPVTSLFAWRAVHGNYPEGFAVDDPDGSREKVFLHRIDGMPAEYRPHALQMYLNPIRNRQELGIV